MDIVPQRAFFVLSADCRLRAVQCECIWMRCTKEDLRERLSEEAYKVTQEGATEPPFTGTYYEVKDDGMYHCIVCGAPLFDSNTKFDSGSGWPSFYDAVKTDAVRLSPDESGRDDANRGVVQNMRRASGTPV